MGLAISSVLREFGDTKSWVWKSSYSSFCSFREAIARAAGYEVCTFRQSNRIVLDWGDVTDAQLNGVWEQTPDDPLHVLFIHYDCDGWIFPAQAAPLAKRLEEVLPLLSGDDAGWHRSATERFVSGLHEAAKSHEPLHFC